MPGSDNLFDSLRWRQVDAAMDALLDAPTESRSAALISMCDLDPAMRKLLGDWLLRVDDGSTVLDHPAATLLATEPSDSQGLETGSRVGSYRILALIGRGGMGEVYLAERADGHYHQKVALKLVLREIADQPSRFQDEKAALARLEHPDIARLLDAGIDLQGRPFMVMEYVVGSTLKDWFHEPGRTLGERLRLFVRICAAVAYAHRNLIVHRDLKPANILVTPDGAPKLLDFGIAKLLRNPHLDSMQTANVPMTPGYAAPELLSRQPVTLATDVYSLGMLLFELLTNQPPWKLDGLSWVAVFDKVLQTDPPAPSRFAANYAEAPIAPRVLRGDLDAIFSKAVRRLPQDRYVDARELGEDVERSLLRQPVQARHGATLYVLRRFLQRRWLPMSAGAAVIIALLGGMAGTLWQAHAAHQEAQRADAVRNFLVGIFRQNSVNNPDGATARLTTAEKLLDIGSIRIRTELKDQPYTRDAMLDTLIDLYDQLERFDKVSELERIRLVEIETRDGTKPSPERADAHFNLGRVLTMNGEYEPAQQELDEALQILNAIHDNSSMLRARVLLHLGRIAYHRHAEGDDALAETLAAEALSIYEHGDNTDPDRVLAIQLRGRLAERGQRLDEAESRYRAALNAARQPQFSNEPVLLAKGYEDLGSLLLVRRSYSEAESMLREAIRIYTASEGETALDTVGVTSYLGQLLVETNRGALGEITLRKGLKMFEDSQGVDNIPSTAVYRLRYAQTQVLRGNLELARELLDKNIDAISKSSPNNHNVLPRSLWLQAQVSIAHQQYEAAASQQRRADALWPAERGRGSEAFADSVIVGAKLEMQFGRSSLALSTLEGVLADWPPLLTWLQEPYVRANLALAESELSMGRLEEAESRMRRLLERLLAQPEHEYLADWDARCRELLSRALAGKRDLNGAAAQLRLAIGFREKLDSPDSTYLRRTRQALAQLH